MDPPGAVAGAIVAQAVIFLLLRRAIVALARSVLARLTLELEPPPRELSDLGIDHDLRTSGMATLRSTRPKGDRVPRSRSRKR